MPLTNGASWQPKEQDGLLPRHAAKDSARRRSRGGADCKVPCQDWRATTQQTPGPDGGREQAWWDRYRLHGRTSRGRQGPGTRRLPHRVRGRLIGPAVSREQTSTAGQDQGARNLDASAALLVGPVKFFRSQPGRGVPQRRKQPGGAQPGCCPSRRPQRRVRWPWE